MTVLCPRIAAVTLANGMENLTVVRCEFRNCQNGIYFEHGEITNTYELSVVDSEFANCAKGIYIYAGATPTTTYVRTSKTIVQDSRFFDCDNGITLGDGHQPPHIFEHQKPSFKTLDFSIVIMVSH
jgi:hypothetical protein